MRIGRKNPKKEKRVMSISLYGNLFFVVVELVIAVITGSQAVLLDAVYDGIEFFMLLPSVFIIPLLYKPSNEKYPFGYMQIESVFLILKGLTMTAVTVGLISNSINILFHGGKHMDFEFIAFFELFACVLGIAVTCMLRKKNRNIKSLLVQAEMHGWQIDSLISCGMAAAFFIPVIFPFGAVLSFSPYLDSVITIVLSMIMLPVPVRTVLNAFRDLLLISPEDETVDEIKSITEPIINKSKCTDICYDIVRTGRKLWISAYITLNKDALSLQRFKLLQNECIIALSEKYTDFYFELLPEIEFDVSEVFPEEDVKAL